MLLTEFNALTGFYPTADLYEEIENAYSSFDGDKTAFCRAYKANEDGMAEAIQIKADTRRICRNAESEKAAAALEESTAALKKEIARLQAALDEEMEWKPYESIDNVSQADYDAKASEVESGSARYMEDGQVYDYLEREFGFSPRAVRIIKEVNAEEINRHNMVRKTEKILSRRPICGAHDDNYVLFQAGAWFWEILDGEIRQYVC